jgi:hypothetical protein
MVSAFECVVLEGFVPLTNPIDEIGVRVGTARLIVDVVSSSSTV